MTRLVHHVGTNGEVHDTPILTTYHHSHQSPGDADFEDMDDESTSPSFFHSFWSLFDCTYLMLANPHPVPSPLGAAKLNGNVRKTPPCTTSEDTSVIIKRPKTDTACSQGRTWLSDFDDLTKSLVNETISIYQAQIVVVQPWPSAAKNWESISQGWIKVCTSRNVWIKLDDEIFKVVRPSLCFSLSFPGSSY